MWCAGKPRTEGPLPTSDTIRTVTALDRHWTYVSDTQRLRAFQQALARTVTQDTVVADLGGGTGVLGMLAAGAGARRVYSIERTGLWQTAAQAARANVGQRFTPVPGHSLAVQLAQPVDLIVIDQMGPLGFEGHLVTCLADAVTRWLVPDGLVIPSRIETCFAPVTATTVRQHITRWQDPGLMMLDLSSFALLERCRPHHVRAQEITPICRPTTGWAIDTRRCSSIQTLEARMTFSVLTTATLDGLCGWFRATLLDNLTMSNSPLDPERINRSVCVLPLTNPVVVEPGDTLNCRVTADSRRLVLTWHVEVLRMGQRLIESGSNSLAYLMSEMPAQPQSSAV